MAPSNDDCTITATGYYTRADATTDTSSDGCGYYVVSTRADVHYECDYSYGKQKERELALEEKLLRIEEMAEIREGWFQRKPEIKQKILKPSIQLRGVCFGGRGWAS
jgi:hypothetical protein